MADRPAERAIGPRTGERASPVRPDLGDASQVFRRRLLAVAVAVVLVWTVAIAIVTAVATGRWGDLGLPTDGKGRPRGLVVIAVATIAAAGAAAAVYRRANRPVSDLLRAVEQVAAGEYGLVNVKVRGPRELRLLTTTLNEMANQLASNEEHRRRFLADITHELRNPLAVLQSEIEAQIDGVHPRDDHHLKSLLHEAQRLGHLVDDLHTLALAETGRLTLRPEVVAFGEFVVDVVERHQAHARQCEVALRASIAAGLPDVVMDPARMRQVFDNLLANSIRHTPAGGEVMVAVTTIPGPGISDGPMIHCRLTDAGPGFPPEHLGQIFERFTGAGDSRGSGLGLSIVRDLVWAHGGTIDARNDPATGSASVTFSLPS